MIGAHFSAVYARLDAEPALAGKGSDTVREEAGGPVRATYWVLFGGAPDELGGSRLTERAVANAEAEFVYTLRLISTTADGVRKLADKALPQLIGFRPTIAGRYCEPIRFDGGGDLDADTRVSPALPFMDLEFVLKSSPA